LEAKSFRNTSKQIVCQQQPLTELWRMKVYSHESGSSKIIAGQIQLRKIFEALKMKMENPLADLIAKYSAEEALSSLQMIGPIRRI